MARPNINIPFLFLLLAYFTFQVVLRVNLTHGLDYDEAEQVLFAQWLLPGYTEQPPLFTWIQHGLFQLFGNKTLALSIMKNALLFFTYLFTCLSALRLLRNGHTAILATLSLLLIPQIGWESQRDMTHTVLVVCAAAGTLLATLRAVEKQSLLNALLLGLGITAGCLGKANYFLFLAILLLTLLSIKEGRQVIFNRFFPLALLLPLLLCGEYFWWMYNNQDIVFSATRKFKLAEADYHVRGIISMVQAITLFLFPFWLFYVLVFPTGVKPGNIDKPDFGQRFIARYILIFLLLLLIVVLSFKVTYVKDRWLQPMLFCAPIWFFSRLTAAQVTAKRFRVFFGLGILAMAGVYIAFTLRIVGAGWYGENSKFSRMNYPFPAMATTLRAAGFDGGLILTNKRFLAGNMLLLFPHSTALIPGYGFEKQLSEQQAAGYKKVLLVWMPSESPKIPEELRRYAEKMGVDVQTLHKENITRPWLYSNTPSQSVVLGTALGKWQGRKQLQ
ncbi:glycosyltransferase family 39 protein [Desulforhopalus vacuolatus]|uniref:ArnT family glycosyltransferase n=1 Tax=Desulforhopalus vacuolatus TaxID=40414 RepID=UPI001963FEBF|nr:glycosyltransferase family 39 protein [Desulforhopalus vacuolatus]MBM9519291.1 glycosyltransferase family 39 protein [Desulforhopalus vacuolatus]